MRISAHIGDNPSKPFVHRIDKHLAPVFRAPNRVVLARIDDIVVRLELHADLDMPLWSNMQEAICKKDHLPHG